MPARSGAGKALLHINYTDANFQDNEELPFGPARAHELYEALFGTLGELIQGKRLIVVPTGTLATLPFQVLLTEKPDPTLTGAERYQKAAWLIRRQPITVLPSVGSLAALRTLGPKDRATRPFIGVGSPLLDGMPHQGEKLAAQARSRQSCSAGAAPLHQQIAAAQLEATRGIRVSTADVRQLTPLPETADELCAIAQEFGVGGDDVLLGSRATRKAVLELNRTGRLGEFAIVHFATHGLVSGELPGLAEPALALTRRRSKQVRRTMDYSRHPI